MAQEPAASLGISRPALIWAGIFIALGLAIRLLISFQGLEFQVSNGPLVDDALYSLKIAKSLAQGKGFTFDGIHQTNGFQPLYVFLMVPVFKLVPHDKLLAVQLALAMLSIFNIAAGYILFRIVLRMYNQRAGLFALGIFCFSPYIIENGLSGLETSIAAFFMLATLAFYLHRIRDRAISWKSDLAFAVLVALLVFSRIDGAIFALALGLDYLFRRPESDIPFARRLARMAGIAAAALLVYSPWIIFSYIQFGNIIPESGSAVRYISQLYGSHLLPLEFPPFQPGHAPAIFYLGNFKKTLFILAQHPIFFPATTLSYLLKVLGIITNMSFLDSWPIHLVLILAGLALFRIAEKNLDCLLFFVILILVAYNLYVFGFWFFYRYFYPLELVFIIMGAAIFYRLDQILRKKKFRFLIPIIAILFLMIFSENGLRMFGQTDDFNIFYYYKLAKGIDKVTKAGARVGTFQAGTVGYFSNRTVINLDGVVNYEALKAMKGNRFLEYIKKERIDYIIEEPNVIRLLLFRTAGGDPSEILVKISAPDMPFELYEVRSSSVP